MTLQTKETVIGDLLKWETPHEVCRQNRRVTRVAAATIPLVVGEMMEPDTAVAQIDTYTCVGTADGGTYSLGYDGMWTAPIAWNAVAAAIKAAFELLATVTDTITASSAAGLVTTDTLTWTTAGHKSTIQIDARLLTDGGVSMDGDSAIATTTMGTAVADFVICATAANCTGVLLESVSLIDLQTDAHIERPFLVASDGVAIINGDELYAIPAQIAAAITAIDALAGINVRYEPNIYQSGPPTS